MTEIRTCAPSLIEAGVCCTDGCTVPATLAVLDEGFIEHTRCPIHEGEGLRLLAVKPLHLSPLWKASP